MSMLNVRLDNEDELKLAQIAASAKTQNKSSLIKRMINDQWVALQAGRTFVERRGGHPEHLLAGSSTSSSRDSRKSELAKHYKSRASHRSKT